MPVPNPLYNPEWEAIHNHHAAERDRLMKEIDSLEYDTPERESATEQFRHHHDACQDSLIMQHPTVQDYAAWTFENLGLPHDVPVSLPDFEDFKTLDEVRETARRISDTAHEERINKLQQLPCGRPNGQDIFENKGDNTLFSFWRNFDRRELDPKIHHDRNDVHTLVSVDTREDEIHVCFMQDYHDHSDVRASLPALATAIYNEARANNSSGSEIRPERFKFYAHLPPNGLYQKEFFAEVSMTFEDGRFGQGKWECHKAIPAFIQSARFNTMEDLGMKKPQVGRLPSPMQAAFISNMETQSAPLAESVLSNRDNFINGMPKMKPS